MGKTLKKARKKAAAVAVQASSGVQKVSVSKVSDRISSALASRSWEDALAGLSLLQAGGVRPKLGAVQRWIRLADLCGEAKQAARLIAGILRSVSVQQQLQQLSPQAPNRQNAYITSVASNSATAAAAAAARNSVQQPPLPAAYTKLTAPVPHSNSADLAAVGPPAAVALDVAPVRRHQAWVPPPPASLEAFPQQLPMSIEPYVGGHVIVKPEVAPPQQQQQQQSKQRSVNRLDPPIRMTPPGAVSFPPLLPPAERIEVPHVPGAFVMVGVLPPQVCQQLIAVSNSMGYAPDVDYTFSSDGASDVVNSAARGAAIAAVEAAEGERATGCVWLADESLLSPIFERCRALLPQVMGGGALAGLNARLRFYCYKPGAVYRPHIDGAWPGSGLSPSGRYLFDAYDGARWSRLTFLLYLNDDFEGGATTFYAPAVDDASCLDAYGVQPRQGNVLCFPHGDVAGSLVHEGSTVTRGAKYVVRTDVLYEVPPRARGGVMRDGGTVAGRAVGKV